MVLRESAGSGGRMPRCTSSASRFLLGFQPADFFLGHLGQFGLFRLGGKHCAVLRQLGDDFQVFLPLAHQVLQPGVFLDSSCARCWLSKVFGSLNAASTSARRRANFSIWGRKSMLHNCRRCIGPGWQGAKTIRPEVDRPCGRMTGKELAASSSWRGRGGLGRLGLDHALLELIHAPGGIHKFLLAGVERMAGVANAHNITGLVERVLITLPQAQRISASTYLGCIFSFIKGRRENTTLWREDKPK